MKKLLSNLVLALLISLVAHSQAPAEVKTPAKRTVRDPRLSLNKLALPPQRVCMAVGAQGVVLTSSDDGATWQVGNIGVNVMFGGLAQVNKKKFVAVGSNKIYRSADAGASWTKSTFQYVSPYKPQTFSGVATNGSTTVIAVGQFPKSTNGASHKTGVIQRSTDGGATFQLAVSETVGPLTAVAYTGNNQFVAAGGSKLMCSTDGGATWSNAAYTNTNNTYKRPTSTSPAPIWDVADIAVAKNGRVVAAGGGSYNELYMPGVIYYSSDGGLSWSDTDYSDKNEYLEAVGTNKLGRWIAMGTNTGRYITSTNNGASWSGQYTDIVTNYRLRSVKHVTGNKWLAVGAQGLIVASTDNGVTWTAVNTGDTKSLFAMVCANTN